MTTNCIVEPRKSYEDRIFTTGEVSRQGQRCVFAAWRDSTTWAGAPCLPPPLRACCRTLHPCRRRPLTLLSIARLPSLASTAGGVARRGPHRRPDGQDQGLLCPGQQGAGELGAAAAGHAETTCVHAWTGRALDGPCSYPPPPPHHHHHPHPPTHLPQELPGFEWEPEESEAKFVTTGFARNAVLGVAGGHHALLPWRVGPLAGRSLCTVA